VPSRLIHVGTSSNQRSDAFENLLPLRFVRRRAEMMKSGKTSLQTKRARVWVIDVAALGNGAAKGV